MDQKGSAHCRKVTTMYYFALLLGPESTSAPDPDEAAAEMAAYQAFHAKAATSIRAGDALTPSTTGARITGGPDAPTVTDGPFAESAEVAGGYYVFEAENLDEALALARDIPAAKRGAVEIWPIVEYFPPSKPVGNAWLALLLEPADKAVAPGTPEWEAGIAAHQKFGAPTAARHCIRRRRQRRFGCATARCYSPTGPTSRAPRWRTATTSSTSAIATRPSRSRR